MFNFISRVIGKKTTWAAIGSIGTGIGLCAHGNVPEGALLIWGGVTAIFGRNAIAKVEANTK